jgi:hypothetical protein
MGKFKWIAVIYFITILGLAPIGLLFLPSWNSKLTPMLNLVDTLLAEGGEERMLLGTFQFVGKDEDSLTLRLDLVVNNTGGPNMLFPAVNLTFNYGSWVLGKGWVSEEVFIPANSNNVSIPIFARMLKGDAFNQFFMSLVGGGLSLSVKAGEAFVFLETFGGTKLGSLSIPLPSIPIPAIELGSTAYPPSCSGIARGSVTPATPVEVRANVSDRGGGVGEVILSWDNGTGWVNTTMTGLPLKDLMGGPTESFFGSIFNGLFPLYPNSTIPTSWADAEVVGQIPGQPNGTVVHYRIYVVDVYGHTTLEPTMTPIPITGTPDAVDLTNIYLTYTVPTGTTPAYTANMTAPAGGGGEAEPDMLADMLETLEDSGVDLLDLIIGASEPLAALTDLKIDLADLEGSVGSVFEAFLPLISYLDSQGLNPFEMLDQLLGFSGGMPGLPEIIQFPRDKNWSINANETLGMDMLLESGVGLLDLMTYLQVNITALIAQLSDSLILPLGDGSQTPAQAIYTALDALRSDPEEFANFIDLLIAHDAFFHNSDLLVLKYNVTDQAILDCMTGPFAAGGVVGDSFYIGSPLAEGLILGDYTTSSFDMVKITLAAAGAGSTYAWEYYNGTVWQEVPAWEYFNGTVWVTDATAVSQVANFTQSGRIKLVLPDPMAVSTFNGTETYWIRANLTGVGGAAPMVQQIEASQNIMDYYYYVQHVDFLGRYYEQPTPGVTDTLLNMIMATNATNGLTMKLLGILESQGITQEEVIGTLNTTTYTIPPPVTGADILASSSIPVAFIVYAMLLLVVVASVRGRKGTYSIAPAKVKKWYAEMVEPAPKSGTWGELERPKQTS